MRPKTWPDYELHSPLQDRFSPRAFADKDIDAQTIRSLFEAARWAPSCFNEQPWSFFVAHRGQQESYEKVFSCINEFNQSWAKNAPLIVISVIKKHFDLDGRENKHAGHDLGLAVAQLTIQAQSAGLSVHQMAGFHPDKAKEVFSIPDGFEALTALAIGYPGNPSQLSDVLQQKEVAPRKRKAQKEFVFSDTWKQPLSLKEDHPSEDILSFWFGETGKDGFSVPEQSKKWWQKDPDFDQLITSKYEQTYEQLVETQATSWLDTPRKRLAALIVLDQFSRNMFRDTAKMYAADDLARQLVHEGLSLGVDKVLSAQERVFFYMPMMHSESLEEQELCIELFKGLADELDGESAERIHNNVEFAIKHRDIVAKFDRFPHRNDILNRTSTPEEVEFLKQPGSSF